MTESPGERIVREWLENHNWHGEVRAAPESPCAQALAQRIDTALATLTRERDVAIAEHAACDLTIRNLRGIVSDQEEDMATLTREKAQLVLDIAAWANRAGEAEGQVAALTIAALAVLSQYGDALTMALLTEAERRMPMQDAMARLSHAVNAPSLNADAYQARLRAETAAACAEIAERNEHFGLADSIARAASNAGDIIAQAIRARFPKP